MADPRFFRKNPSISIADISKLVTLENIDALDKEKSFDDVSALDTATATKLSFLDNIKYKTAFAETKAGACFVRPELASLAPAGTIPLITNSPYKAYALAAQFLYPADKSDGVVAESARIHESARIAGNVQIGEKVTIENGVEIGKNTIIEAGAVIRANVKIGVHCKIGANAVISFALIGDYVSIYNGACIGQDGFGFAIDPAGFVKVPQLGRVIIEDHVEIGANTTIDRGAGPDTVIGQGTWMDNLVQIGHNVKVGKGCVIVAQSGIAGSTVIDDFVMIGGQTGIAGHLRIGKGVRIGAQSGIIRDVPAGSEVMGSPSMPKKEYMRQTAMLKKMINKDRGK